MNYHIQLLILCFILAIAVTYITHKAKNISRKNNSVLVLGVISGFTSFVISLMLLSSYPESWMLIGSMEALFILMLWLTQKVSVS